MGFVRRISVEGLFGLYDHSIDVRSSPRVTVIAGPNGIGKTTLLSLTQALLSGDLRRLAKHDFKQLAVMLQDGRELSATPTTIDGEDDEPPRRIFLKVTKGDETLREEIFDAPAGSHDLALPPYVEQQGLDLFFDQRVDEHLTYDEALARYGRLRHHGKPQSSARAVWRDDEREDWKIDFIETKRLDTLMAMGRRHRGSRKREPDSAPIHVYLNEVTQRLAIAQRQSDRIRQVRDRSFARRLLDKASKMRVKEPELRERYADIGAEAKQLARNGLLTDSLDVLPQSKLTPTDRRILSLFLDDFEAKLKPLRHVSSLVERLQSVLDSKFLNKSVGVDPAKGVQFFASPDGHPIAPEALSSGEQHQLALISRLLFRETPGTTVLIDEPELSLHVSWQHEMIDDLAEIAKVANLSFVLATHSTAIINGRWDLVEELAPFDAQKESSDH